MLIGEYMYYYWFYSLNAPSKSNIELGYLENMLEILISRKPHFRIFIRIKNKDIFQFFSSSIFTVGLEYVMTFIQPIRHVFVY